MKIVIAPDSFKESLSAVEVARQIEAGFREIFPDAQYVSLPVADGGEGTVAAMVAATGGQVVPARVTGPLGAPIDAFFGLSGDGRRAFIEMAAASGLEQTPPGSRNPLLTTSYGTGELIARALDRGVRHCIIGIGGSATNDGGAGMAQALGARLLDAQGREIGRGGGALAGLSKIDISRLDPRLHRCRFDIACDVTNVLTGEHGASAVFGPQKGATPAMVAELDLALARYAQIIRRDLAVAVADVPGAGAAGGMGAGLLAFTGAKLRRGIAIVTDALELDALVRDADLVITGEGRLDSQSVSGKVPIGVAGVARRHGRPTIAIAGSLAADAAVLHRHGLDAAFSVLNRICTLEEALAQAGDNLRCTARNIAATIRLAQEMREAPAARPCGSQGCH